MSGFLLTNSGNNTINQTFLNAEAMFQFNGARSGTIFSKPDYALSTWTICFTVVKNQASGNTYFSQSGGVTINDSILTELQTEVQSNIIINSQSTVYIDGYESRTIAPLGNLLNANINVGGGGGNFSICNLCLFDKALTDLELLEIALEEGVLPNGTPINCQGFWTFQQQFAHEIVAGDRALNNTNLAIGDDIIFDSLRMTNPDKSTDPIPSHIRLNGFADNEIGINEEATNIKNFYNTDIIYRPNGKRYESANSMYDASSNFTEFEYTQPCSFIIPLDVRSNPAATETVFSTSNPSNQGKGIVIQLLTNNSISIRYVGNSTTNDIAISWPYPNTNIGNLLITYNGNGQASGFNAYYQGELLTPNVIRDNLNSVTIVSDTHFTIGANALSTVGYNQFLNRTLYGFEIINSEITDQQEIEYIGQWNTAEGLGKTWLLYVLLSKKTSNPTTLPNTPTYTITTSKTGSSFTPRYGDTYFEAKTDLPPLGQCLRLESASAHSVDFDTAVLPDGTHSFTHVSLNFGNVFASATPNRINNYVYMGDNVGAAYPTLFNRHLIQYSSTGNILLLQNDFRNSFNQLRNVNKNPLHPGAVRLNWGSMIMSAKVVDLENELMIGYLNGIEVNRTSLAGFSPYDFTAGNNFGSGFNPNWKVNLLPYQPDQYNVLFAQFDRALDPWMLYEIFKNSLNGNPFAWFTTQQSGFQDLMSIMHQYQADATYWDGSNYRLTNFGSGADATLNNYTTGSADFATDNPNSLFQLFSLY